MKKRLFQLLFLFSCQSVFGQGPVWKKVFDAPGYNARVLDMLPDDSGDVFALTISGGTYFVMHLDALGDLVWELPFCSPAKRPN